MNEIGKDTFLRRQEAEHKARMLTWALLAYLGIKIKKEN